MGWADRRAAKKTVEPVQREMPPAPAAIQQLKGGNSPPQNEVVSGEQSTDRAIVSA